MPVSLFNRWMAFYLLSPFDEERDDLRMARICHVLASMLRGKDSSVPDARDFLFPYGAHKNLTEKPQDWRTIREMCKALATVRPKPRVKPEATTEPKPDKQRRKGV